MTSLQEFDPYTSYHLHWFPYEITRCKNLNDSRVSTRAIYGNFKFRPNFPDLTDNPVVYHDYQVKCSVCDSTTPENGTFNQVWISLWVGTDTLPLLANICSDACLKALPTPPDDYIAYPHKGGTGQEQPLDYLQKLRNEHGDDL